MYNICNKSGYYLAGGVWSRSQLENHKNYHGPHDLLQYQLMCLRVKGEKDEFPTINIHLIHEVSECYARELSIDFLLRNKLLIISRFQNLMYLLIMMIYHVVLNSPKQNNY